jgi:hypothetical protein
MTTVVVREGRTYEIESAALDQIVQDQARILAELIEIRTILQHAPSPQGKMILHSGPVRTQSQFRSGA